MGVWLIVGCTRPNRPPIDDDPQGPRLRAEQTHSELVALGASSSFEVLSFETEPEREGHYVDDFDYPTWQTKVPFRARVKLTRPLEVATPEQLVREQRRPGWVPSDTRKGFVLALLFRPGTHEQGDVVEVSGEAAFDRLEPGARFRTFDRRR